MGTRTCFVDCFLFNDELDLLEFRLHEHDSFVDLFIIVECEKTFSGKQKPIYAQENKERFAKWNHKIVYVSFDLPKPMHGFGLENYSREIGLKKIQELVLNGTIKKDAIISAVSDVDEIYDEDIIKDILPKITKEYVVRPMLRFHYYSLSIGRPSMPYWTPQKRLKLFTCDTLIEYTLDELSKLPHKDVHKIGWHLSYFGGVDVVIKKLSEFSHCSMESVKECIHNRDLVKHRLENGIDILGRSHEKLEFVTPEKVPKCVDILHMYELDIFM